MSQGTIMERVLTWMNASRNCKSQTKTQVMAQSPVGLIPQRAIKASSQTPQEKEVTKHLKQIEVSVELQLEEELDPTTEFLSLRSTRPNLDRRQINLTPIKDKTSKKSSLQSKELEKVDPKLRPRSPICKTVPQPPSISSPTAWEEVRFKSLRRVLNPLDLCRMSTGEMWTWWTTSSKCKSSIRRISRSSAMQLVKRHQSRGLTKTLDQFTSTIIVEEFKFHKVWWSTIMATWLRHQMNLICLLSKYPLIRILFRTTWCLLTRTLQWARVSLQSQSKEMLWILRTLISLNHQ